jgi:hypothetical protein
MAWVELIGGFVVALIGTAMLLYAARSSELTNRTANVALTGLVLGVIGALFFIMGGMTFIARAVFA